jgi:membrane protein DedA with SNARE-associated domain
MIAHLIDSSPYAGILAALWAGGLGLPVPEEVPIVTAGVLAHRGVVRWWLALAVCLTGVLSADVALYWAGRHWGDRALDRPLLRRLLDPARLDRLATAYRRHGVVIVFAARHVAGFRSAAFLTAGIARIPFAKFLAADGLAAGYGVPLSFGLAYLFTDHIQALLEDMHRVERWIGLLVLLAAAGALGVAAWRRSRRALSGD